MTAVLPERHEADMLYRLRTLRVQRARERCGEAQAAVVRAEQAVRERMRLIDRSRRDIDALGHAVAHALAPTLPRWGTVAAAQREKLADRIERDEYALISDERALEEAQEQLQQARADVTRALAREGAVRDLAQETRRAYAQSRERRAERDLEDQAHRPKHGQQGQSA
jgi:hypothetical protein